MDEAQIFVNSNSSEVSLIYSSQYAFAVLIMPNGFINKTAKIKQPKRFCFNCIALLS